MSALLDGFFDAEIDDGVITIRRTEKRSDDMDAFLRSFDGVYEAIGSTPPNAMALLIDLRASVGRNDPEFEQRLAESRRELFRCFGRTAVLVRTAVGRLQVQRHIDEDGYSTKVQVFVEEADALVWLRRPRR